MANEIRYVMVTPTISKNYLRIYFPEINIFKVSVCTKNEPKGYGRIVDIIEVLDEHENQVEHTKIKKLVKALDNHPGKFSTDINTEVKNNININVGSYGYSLLFKTFEEALIQKKIYLKKIRNMYDEHISNIQTLINKKIPEDIQ